MPNSTGLWKLLKIAECRTPKLQAVRKKGSKILQLPPVRNYFTLGMTNKLVVIINSLKAPKIRKFYYMKWNFLYQITAASRTPDLGATGPRSPFSLSSTEFVDPPSPEQNSWVRHWNNYISIKAQRGFVTRGCQCTANIPISSYLLRNKAECLRSGFAEKLWYWVSDNEWVTHLSDSA